MRKAAPWLAIALVMCLHFAADLWWIGRHTAYNGTSEGDLVAKELEFADFWKSAGSDTERVRYLLARERITDTPRLLFLSGSVAMKIFGRSLHALLYSMAAWHVLLLLAVFLFGRETMGTRPALLGAALVGFMPQVYDYARAFCMYPSSAALFLLALIALFRSRGLLRFIPSAAFALLACAQMLTERGAPMIFLAGPVAVCVLPSLRENVVRPRKLFWFNAAIAVAAFAVLVWPYFRGYMTLTMEHIGERLSVPFFDPGDYWYGSKFAVFYYAAELAMKQAGPLVAAAFYISLIALWKRPFPNRAPFVAAMAVPFAVFSLIATKDITYVLPWLPFVGLTVAHGVASLPGRWLRVGVAVLLLLIGGFNFASWTFGLRWVERINEPSGGRRAIAALLTNFNGRFQPRAPDPSWRLTDAAEKIETIIRGRGRVYLHYRYRVGPDDPNFDLAFAVAFRDPAAQHIIRFRSMPDTDPARDLTVVTIMPTDEWAKEGCAPDAELSELLLKFTVGRFVEQRDDEAARMDRYVAALQTREVARGWLAPGFPYVVEMGRP